MDIVLDRPGWDKTGPMFWMEPGGREDHCHRDSGPSSKADSQGLTKITQYRMPRSEHGAIDPHGRRKPVREELKA